MTMYPPPPRLPASGYATASANPTATAASTAFPPRRRISTPASVAAGLLLATIALGAVLALRDPAGNLHPGGNSGRACPVDALALSVAASPSAGGAHAPPITIAVAARDTHAARAALVIDSPSFISAPARLDFASTARSTSRARVERLGDNCRQERID